jgi:hypothetical protein
MDFATPLAQTVSIVTMRDARKGAKMQRKGATRGGMNLPISSRMVVTGFLCAFAPLRDNVFVVPQRSR